MVNVWITICILVQLDEQKLYKRQKEQNALLSAPFAYTPYQSIPVAYCILNNKEFWAISLLFDLWWQSLKNSNSAQSLEKLFWMILPHL